MKRGPIVFLMAVVLTGLCGSPVQAFNQPPLNLGLTDILDGGVPGVGTFFTEYVQAYQSSSFKDGDGNNIPGSPDVAFLLSMNQLVHVYKHKLLGAHIGVDLLLPVVAISTTGSLPTGAPPPAPAFFPLPSNSSLLGDLTFGPFLQWLDTKLLGRPIVQRFELDFTFPTGQYDSQYLLNPGSNHWVIEPYYAFTWFLTPKLSTSWRIHYTYSTKNDDPFDGLKAAGVTELTPGQAFHFNYSLEYEFFKGFRGALAGYYLKQLTEDDTNLGDLKNITGDSTTKEQVFAIGPAIHYFFSNQFSAGLKTSWETGTENRPEGNRTTLRFTYLF
ncbi:MAG TPA: transporter [Candidatus Deferrimicrobiaceae bacterium]|nr:transporter [Candidatus Deferrimicrobiaceae bacterium]